MKARERERGRESRSAERSVKRERMAIAMAESYGFYTVY